MHNPNKFRLVVFNTLPGWGSKKSLTNRGKMAYKTCSSAVLNNFKYYSFRLFKFGWLAQLVEHRFYTPRVGSSSLSPSTSFKAF